MSLAPSRPRSGKPQPPPPTGLRRLYTSPTLSITETWALRTLLSVTTQEALSLDTYAYFNPGAPTPAPYFPRTEESGSPAPSSLKDSGNWAFIFILLLPRPHNPSSRGTSFEARELPGPRSVAGAAHPRNPTAGHLVLGSLALYQPANLDPQEDLVR